MSKSDKKLVIIDSNSVINRTYYAISRQLITSDGTPVHAVFGFLKILSKILKDFNPSHCVATFDLRGRNFRNDIYPEYKANRKKTDESLIIQINITKEILRHMGICIVEKSGVEADDIIGSLVNQFDGHSYIISSDGDLHQLISESISYVRMLRGYSDVEMLTLDNYKEKYGIMPNQVIDKKALMGDSSDNIPGGKNIGPKKAQAILDQFNNIDNMFANINNMDKKLSKYVIASENDIKLSYTLATILTNLQFNICEDDYKYSPLKVLNASDILLKYEMKSLLKAFGMEDKEEEKEKKNTYKKTILLDFDDDKLKEIILKNEKKEKLAIVHIDNYLYFSFDKINSYKVNIENVELEEVYYLFRNFIQNMHANIVFCNIKEVLKFLDLKNLKLTAKSDDILISSYLLDSGRKYKDIADVISIDDFISCNMFYKNDENINMLKSNGMYSLYLDVEMPLIYVLYDIQKNGMSVDSDKFAFEKIRVEAELLSLEEKIHTLVDEKFNINSPKQVGEILFNKLGLKSGKKTKTGFSTSEQVLEKIKHTHPVVEQIIKYRHLNKLYGTYIIGLEGCISSESKIHSTLNQTFTSTGRLTSSDPNLQNIPIRDLEAKFIREMFIPSKKSVLMSFDYSQIELRLLAHLSEDETMISNFNDMLDIHTSTAAKIYNVALEDVTLQMRREAKAINFGVIYGMGAYRLAEDTGFTVQKASEFIENYFSIYPGVKKYLDSSIEFARKNSYIESILNRRRYITEYSNSNKMIQAAGDRIAMNMPLQGSASDIIKLAMIKIYEIFNKRNINSKMIMQVHDELIFDVLEEEIVEVRSIVRECMENIYKLNVPLIVDINMGANWNEAK